MGRVEEEHRGDRLAVELLRGEERGNVRRGVLRKAPGGEGLGGEGVAPGVEHGLGEGADGGLDAQVMKHGIRLPPAQQLDLVGRDAGHEKGSGAPRS